MVGVGRVDPDEQGHPADQFGGDPVGDGAGLGLVVGWNGVLEVDDGAAGTRPGELGQHLGPVAGGEQQAPEHQGGSGYGGHGADATDPLEGESDQVPARSRAMERTSAMAPARSATSTSVAPSVARKQRTTRWTGRPVDRSAASA